MPWSPWITSAPKPWLNALEKYQWNNATGSYVNDDAHTAITNAYLAAASTPATTRVFGRFGLPSGFQKPDLSGTFSPTAGTPFAEVYLDQLIRWYDLAAVGDYSGERDWHPDEFLTMTEGVDYIGRPDRTPFDDDYYMEYEPGVATFAGWYALGSIGFDPAESLSTSLASARIALATAMAPEEPPLFGGTFAETPVLEPQTGPALVTVTGGGSATSVDLAPGIGSLTAFGIAILTDAEPWPLDEGAAVPTATWVVNNSVTVLGKLLFPRWRYWMPDGGTYLWNVRSDGLGRNNLWNLPKTRQSTLWNQAPR